MSLLLLVEIPLLDSAIERVSSAIFEGVVDEDVESFIRLYMECGIDWIG